MQSVTSLSYDDGGIIFNLWWIEYSGQMSACSQNMMEGPSY